MSWEAEQSGGGIFSPCSHRGLKGMADGNGQVTGVSEGEDWNPQDPPRVTFMSQGPCWQGGEAAEQGWGRVDAETHPYPYPHSQGGPQPEAGPDTSFGHSCRDPAWALGRRCMEMSHAWRPGLRPLVHR